MLRRAALLLLVLVASCHEDEETKKSAPRTSEPLKPPRPKLPWDSGDPLADGEVYDGKGKTTSPAGLVVDLSDEWAPFIFSEEEGKPNRYRQTFIALANNRVTPDELFLDSTEGRRAVLTAAGLPLSKKPTPEEKKAMAAARRTLGHAPNFLEPYGIPPTLSVLRARWNEDKGKVCWGDNTALAGFAGSVAYLSRDQARREHAEALADAQWAETLGDAGVADAKTTARMERLRRGQERLRAVRAVQARLVCEEHLSPKSKYVDGMFDLPTHEALAAWERKNDIFAWGFLQGETLEALQRPRSELHLETLKRILAERLADAAGIIEDGSVSKGKKPAMYKDADDNPQPVPDLISTYIAALLGSWYLRDADDLGEFLERGGDRLAKLKVAFTPPALPPYYGPEMDLSVEIDRGDIWYDFPWDEAGKPIEQPRVRYPNLTVFVTWNKQRIPLARWRTTIGSWRSERGEDGQVYYKYKNSDVGPRIWKNIVAAPVWVPPDGTPAKDLLTRKVFDHRVGAVPVVNTDVMGPGFQSAYGLAMAIHIRKDGFDNQIRSHGSVDYTSIARRFSHGCHRLVNNRAVRLFGFVLKHRPHTRMGQSLLGPMKKRFSVEDKEFEYRLDTRGYYYELTPPLPVNVTEGRIMGKVPKPITAYVRKPGVEYEETVPAAGP